jgi:hypothetical protein
MQTFVKTTPAILAYKALNRNIDKFWIDWAVEMLMNGFDTENLVEHLSIDNLEHLENL